MKKLFFSFLLVIASITNLFIIIIDKLLHIIFNFMYFIYDIVNKQKHKLWIVMNDTIVNI